jgi:hypothetical protein
VRAYLRQQRAYGEAEGLLERKWPERYNLGGHLRWNGRVYGGSTPGLRPRQRWRIYYGTWGSGLFQSVYERAPSVLGSLPLLPEWYLVLFALVSLSAVGLVWPSLALELPGTEVPLTALLAALGTIATCGHALASGWRAFRDGARTGRERARLRVLTSALFLLQPLVRLAGRLRHGLTPWRHRPALAHVPPWPRTMALWSELWQPPAKTLLQLEADLRRVGTVVRRGGAFDRWDVEARVGTFGAARVRLAVEEHGRGRQLFRFRMWPRWSRFGLGLELVLVALAAYGLARGDVVPSVAFAAVALALAVRIVRECAAAAAAAATAVESQGTAAAGLAETLTLRVVESTLGARVLEPVGAAEVSE